MQYSNIIIHALLLTPWADVISPSSSCIWEEEGQPPPCLAPGEGGSNNLHFWLWGGCRLNDLILPTTNKRTTSYPRTDIPIVTWGHKSIQFIFFLFSLICWPWWDYLHYNMEKISIIHELFQPHTANTAIHNARHVVSNLQSGFLLISPYNERIQQSNHNY